MEIRTVCHAKGSLLVVSTPVLRHGTEVQAVSEDQNSVYILF